MKLAAALQIIHSEINKIQGASPAFYIALGYILGRLEMQMNLDLKEIEVEE